MFKKIFFKKVILVSLVGILAFFLSIKPAKAFQTPSLDYQFQFIEALEMEEMNLQSFVNETVKAVAASIQYLGMGKFWDKEESVKNPGLLGSTTFLIAGLYANPPASGIQYFADIGQKLGITKQTYAQAPEDHGYFAGMIPNGFKLMSVTQPIWKVFRNISYILMVLILIGIGFAVMFRLKISPQAVITIQSALPKIVFALILITFSYAIVGLMIDIALFLSKLISMTILTSVDDLFEAGFLDKAKEYFNVGGVGGLFGGLFGGYLALVIAAPLIFMFVITFIVPVGILLGIIIFILLLIALIRTLWTLLKTFAMIVINLTFGPFQILIGTLPGSNAIGAWFKNIAANVAILPVITAMFFFGGYLMLAGIVGFLGSIFGAGGDVLILIGEFRFLEASQAVGETVAAGPTWLLNALLFPFIGIFVWLLIPKASEIIQSALTKKPFQYGAAIGETMSPVTGMANMAKSYGTSFITGYAKEKGALRAKGLIEKESGSLREDDSKGLPEG
jgi:hypothetical protein